MKVIAATLDLYAGQFDEKKLGELQEVTAVFFKRFFVSYFDTLLLQVYGGEDGSVWLTVFCGRFKRNITFKISDSFHGNLVEISIMQDDFIETDVFSSDDFGDISRFSDRMVRRLKIECKKDSRGSKKNSARVLRKGA